MKNKICVGDMMLLESSTIIMSTTEQELKIDILDIGTVVMRFVYSSKTPKEHFQANMENDTLVITCYNFTNSTGNGNAFPIVIGEHDGKTLYMYIWIYFYGGLVRKVEYNLYENYKNEECRENNTEW